MRNRQFSILICIAIVLVIIGYLGGIIAYRISLKGLVDFLPQPEQIFTLHNLFRKLLYFLFFFHLGRFYRNYWQPREQKWSISLLIEKLIPSNICEDFISTHTWDIMTHHLFVIFIINTLLVRYAPELINIAKYRSSVFYCDTPIREAIYVFAALIIPLFWGYCKDNILMAGKHFYQSCRKINK